MAVANGVENIQWLFLLAMLVLLAIAPIFGWITSRFRTRQFLSYITLFFALNLVVFYFLFLDPQRPAWVTRAFYVWVNAFSMFIVSLFWSFMNDIFKTKQARRLFAFIAAGGTAGAISGPLITSSLVEGMGLAPLLLISAATLATSTLTIRWLVNWRKSQSVLGGHEHSESTIVAIDTISSNDEPAQSKDSKFGDSLGGGALSGLKLILNSPYLLAICLFITLYAVSITFVVIQQA